MFKTLNNGIKMPAIAYGTSHRGGYSHEAMSYALTKANFIHIDTAGYYGTEPNIGEDLEKLQIPRDSIFLASKLSPIKYDDALVALNESLKNLKTSFFDLYLMHWPEPHNCCEAEPLKDVYAKVWGILEDAYKEGRCKAIGVSNFQIHHLKLLLSICNIKPMLNQIEIHPYNYNEELIEFCRSNDIQVQAYSPLAAGEIFSDETLLAPFLSIASKHERTPAQVILRWFIQHDIPFAVKSLNNKHILQSISLFDFSLDEEDMRNIDELSKSKYLQVLKFKPKKLVSTTEI